MPNYRIENTIVMRGGYRRLVQQADLDEAATDSKAKPAPCHIYMICSRPRLLIKHDSMKITPEEITLVFEKYYAEKTEEIAIATANNRNIRYYNLDTGRNRVQFLDKSYNIITDIKASLLYPCLISEYDCSLDLEIHYIGQAFGEQGARLAIQRLKSHETLQMIYSEILSCRPSQDPWLLLWNFEPYYISAMGSPFKNAEIGFERSLEHYYQSIESTISLDQQVTISEAALIKYFQPEYNIHYKTNFPSNSHSTYSHCYELDFNSVAIELDTYSICTRLWSEIVPPSLVHVASFFLHNKSERVDMFNLDLWNRDV